MPPPVVDNTLACRQHLRIDVDDVDDENLLQHFPAATKFIQSGLDAGGSVLIHWLVRCSVLIHVVNYWSTELQSFEKVLSGMCFYC